MQCRRWLRFTDTFCFFFSGPTVAKLISQCWIDPLRSVLSGAWVSDAWRDHSATIHESPTEETETVTGSWVLKVTGVLQAPHSMPVLALTETA